MTKIAVLRPQVKADATKDELDVLAQAAAVSQALTQLGHEPVEAVFSLDLKTTLETLSRIQPALVFNLVEAVESQGRLICLAPLLLDYLGLPYTGAGAEAMFLTSHKVVAKRFLQASGLATPPWYARETLAQAVWDSPQTVIIKSVWEHASIGLEEEAVLRIDRADQLRTALGDSCKRLGGDCFAEKFIPGREFNLSLLAGNEGPEVLPPAEILFPGFPEGKPRIVGYRAKWDEDSFEYQHTVRSFEFPREDDPLLFEIAGLAKTCWRIFGLRGYARVDFRVDPTGKPWILEINANPCLAPEGGFVAAAERAGLTFPEAIERILQASAAFRRAALLRRKEEAARFLPPGAHGGTDSL